VLSTFCGFNSKNHVNKRSLDMRIAFISDMHGNAVAFEEVVKDLEDQSPDVIVCLGDIVMKGPQPKECIDILNSLEPISIVRGNHEHLYTRYKKESNLNSFKEILTYESINYDLQYLSVKEQEWLSNLPENEILMFGDRKIDIFHASPKSLNEVIFPWAPIEDLDKLYLDPTSDFSFYGHVHHAFVRNSSTRSIVNTGSIGLPFDKDNRASYAILDLGTKGSSVQLRRVQYNVEKAIKIAYDRKMPFAHMFEFALRKAEYPYIEQLFSSSID
jgi:putative phosphoesterase